MNVTLQKHDAKHIYKVPEGLRELCTDISREVLRSQPTDLYGFIAEYVDTLLITRENTKIAVKVVNNILLGSQAILGILYRAGYTLEQIAVAAPRIQKAFREYLDMVDIQPTQICEDYSFDEESRISIRSILEATGSTRESAERAATVIQAAFRGHYERMALNEAQGLVQWQRAVANTLDILRKAGATQVEISKAVGHLKILVDTVMSIFSAGTVQEPPKKDERILEPAEAIQAVAWMEMMYEDSGLTLEKANEAASIIQRAYKRYRQQKQSYDVQKVESTKSFVVAAILDHVRHKVFETVLSRDDIPKKFGSREEIVIASSEVELTVKEHMRKMRLSMESFVEFGEGEEGGYEEMDEWVTMGAPVEEAQTEEQADITGEVVKQQEPEAKIAEDLEVPSETVRPDEAEPKKEEEEEIAKEGETKETEQQKEEETGEAVAVAETETTEEAEAVAEAEETEEAEALAEAEETQEADAEAETEETEEAEALAETEEMQEAEVAEEETNVT